MVSHHNEPAPEESWAFNVWYFLAVLLFLSLLCTPPMYYYGLPNSHVQPRLQQIAARLPNMASLSRVVVPVAEEI